MCKLTLQY